MKPIRMLARSIRDAFKSVIRNFSLSLASISCITITLIIVAVAIIASFNVQNFTKEIEKDLTIVVFLEQEATSSDIKDVETEIKQMDNVDTYSFQSKQDVKKQMQQESEVFNTVLSNWEDDESPLKDTYQVKVKDVTKIGKTADQIKEIENWAFESCYMTSVTLNNGLEKIGKEVFARNQISVFDLPSSVTTIGEDAFYKWNYSNPNLTKIIYML